MSKFYYLKSSRNYCWKLLILVNYGRFVTLFTSVLHIRVLLRVWDLFFCEGSAVLFRMALAMIRTHELHLKELQNSADIFNALSDLPRHINEVDELIDLAYSLAGSFSDVTLDSYRRRHLAYLMSDRGTLVGNPESAANLPKQHLSRLLLLHRYIQKSSEINSQIILNETIEKICLGLLESFQILLRSIKESIRTLIFKFHCWIEEFQEILSYLYFLNTEFFR